MKGKKPLSLGIYIVMSNLMHTGIVKKAALLVYKCLYFIFWILRYLINRDSDKKMLVEGPDFKTFFYRPIYSVNVATTSDDDGNLPPMVIVMQGPVLKDYDFTFETIKIYKKHFQNTKIILSTWEGEKIPPEHGADEIVLSKKPDYAGVFNINMQIVSSINGINRARELGFEYVVKTRTDQRFYAVNIKKYLFNLIDIFPPHLTVQKSRLAGFSFNSSKPRRIITDMFMFGHIEDMIKWWSPELTTPETTVSAPEFYFQAEYFKKIGFDAGDTAGGFYRFLADCFIVIDSASFDFYWPKYTAFETRFVRYWHHVLEGLSFKDWFNIYHDYAQK
jgi:hypothetical protein